MSLLNLVKSFLGVCKMPKVQLWKEVVAFGVCHMSLELSHAR
jgi:hypothetical protein